MTRRRWFWAAALAAAAVAAGHAWLLRWTCDDAYITFRYAAHFAEGHGLVFNRDPAEAPVEGYSNFTWTMWMAAGMALGFVGDAVEGWAAAWGSLCHGATVLVLAWAAAGAGRGRRLLPVAALGWAALHHGASLAPAGLETALFTLLVTAMAVRTIVVRCPRDGALLGWLGVLAALTRPDGALPCAVVGAFLLADALRTRRAGTLLAYLLPFVLAFVPFLLWRHGYYGQWVPNTFFAKSGADPYPGQGLRYLVDFFACYWVLLPAAALLLWTALQRPGATAPIDPWAGRRPGLVLTAFCASYLGFVVWVGGDFMFARFVLPVVPALLLATDVAAGRWRPGATVPLAAVLVAGLLLRGDPEWLRRHDNGRGYSDNRLITLQEVRWPTPDGEWVGTFAEACAHAGAYLQELFAGLDVRLGIAGSHANFAYRSRVPVAIECATGLTDAYIAHLPAPARGVTGHEKNYTQFPGYLQRRGVQLMMELSFHTGGPADPFRDVVFPSRPVPTPMRLVIYDAALMAELRRRDPAIRFVPFEQVLDHYLGELAGKTREEVARDLAGFRDFYFDHNDDPMRLRPLLEFLAR